MGKEYRLEPAELGDSWDHFIQASDCGTVFCLTPYLRHVNARIAPYWCFNKGERRAAVLMVEDGAGSAILHDFVIYNGVVFGSATHRQNRSQQLSERFEISAFLAAELAARYRAVAVSLSPAVVDIRAFLWFNHGTDGPKYVPDVRYTSYVSIADFRGAAKLKDIELYHAASAARRQEIRYGIGSGAVTREEFDAVRFVSFYNATMKRQQIAVEDSVREEMRRLIIGLHEARLARMFVSYTADGMLGSMALMATDAKRGYYVFGANDPSLRDSHTGTTVLWDAFRMLAADGVSEVDLEGVNSPKRGWFKLSFGGSIVPYYQFRLRQP